MSVQSEPATPAAASERAGGDLFRVLAANVRQYGMLVALLVIEQFIRVLEHRLVKWKA